MKNPLFISVSSPFYAFCCNIHVIDTEKDIEERIAFAQEYIDLGERDMILEDVLGRKIHIKSNEMWRLYEDIEFMIKCRIEREFNDPTRYAYVEDMKGTFDNMSKELE